jgi:hypothetical protein
MEVVVDQCKPDPAGKSVGALTVRLVTWPYGRQVSDFTLSGKTSKESTRCPYPKPTQVDKVNIHRRSRERSLRN